MVTPNNGISLQFDIGQEPNEYYRTSIVNKWYPDISNMTFAPKQFHFHHGTNHKNESENGSEHTFNGVHMDAEMHIVHMNENPDTTDNFLAAVTGILFKANEN